jgi:hypothetical protein
MSMMLTGCDGDIGGQGIGFVQSASATTATSTTNPVTISSSGSGHFLMAFIAVTGTAATSTTVSGVTDNKSQTWSQISGFRSTDGATLFFDGWYFENTTSGVTTVTATIGSALLSCDVIAMEFRGVSLTAAPYSVGATNNGTTGTALNNPAVTTTEAGDLILCCLGGTTGNVSSINSPYSTNAVLFNNKGYAFNIPATIVTSQQATFNMSLTTVYASSSAAFKQE